MSSDPPAPYIYIAQRKRAERDALIPVEWRLPTETLSSLPSNVMNIPAKSGILSARELEITEGKRWDGRGLVGAMKKGELGVEDVVRAFCKRAALAQQLTNCLTELLFAPALRRAAHLSTLPVASQGPLHGLPITIKDSFHYAGVDSSIGLAALCFQPATTSAPLVRLLESLGAVVIAKTNVPQTLGALDSINNVFGRTMNPLNRKLTAGGSSGGEGVVTAMRGSVVGWGTDVGGSIRIPGMCDGVYGIKPSVGRVPFGGQESGGVEGLTRCGGLQAVAGPIARDLEDTVWTLQEVASRAHLWDTDCIPGFEWPLSTPQSQKGSGPNGEFVIGILSSDGNTPPLPPIRKLLAEVNSALNDCGVRTIALPTPRAWAQCQSLSVRLMAIDGGQRMNDLIAKTGESLIPWLAQGGRLGRGQPRTLDELREMAVRRTRIEHEMQKLWFTGAVEGEHDDGRTPTSPQRWLDAIICPVAPHPVPEIDRWNAVGYTSSFVLLDWPAGVVPVRRFEEADMELGKETEGEPISTWDRKNRELWDEKTVDRRVYLDSLLSVQVVTPKLHDADLGQMMEVVANAVQRSKDSKLRARI